MVPETIRDGRETVGDISGGKGAGLRSPSPVVKIVKNCIGSLESYKSLEYLESLESLE